MTVEAEQRVSIATAQVVRFHLAKPVDDILRDTDVYRLDLCLTPRPRNARACYGEHWAPHRFERIGDVFLLPPGETIRARSDGGRQRSVICRVYPEPSRDWFPANLRWTEQRLLASLDITDSNIRGLLLRLAEEIRHPGFASDVLVELIAAQITIELGRYCEAIDISPVSGGLAPWRLKLIDERLQEVGAAPRLAELAALCRLSVRQLTRGFRVSRGCSIGDYVTTSRLEQAKRLLGSDQSVKEIAYSLGFASPSSFCFAFRRATGQSPRQFRLRR